MTLLHFRLNALQQQHAADPSGVLVPLSGTVTLDCPALFMTALAVLISPVWLILPLAAAWMFRSALNPSSSLILVLTVTTQQAPLAHLG